MPLTIILGIKYSVFLLALFFEIPNLSPRVPNLRGEPPLEYNRVTFGSLCFKETFCIPTIAGHAKYITNFRNITFSSKAESMRKMCTFFSNSTYYLLKSITNLMERSCFWVYVIQTFRILMLMYSVMQCRTVRKIESLKLNLSMYFWVNIVEV